VDQLGRTFLEEGDELLRHLEEGMLALERTPDDREVLHAVFRAAHTLKGNSGLLGYTHITAVTHRIEEMLARVRDGLMPLTPAVATALLGAIDVLRALLAAARGEDDPDASGRAEAEGVLDAILAGRQGGAPGVRYRIEFTPPADLLRRGLEPLHLFDGLQALGRVEDLRAEPVDMPPLESMDPERAYLRYRCQLTTSATHAEIAEVFDWIDDPDAVDIRPVVPTADLGSRESPASRRDGEVHSVRVATEKIDALVDLVGELVISHAMATDVVEHFVPSRLANLAETMAAMARQTRELQERIMAIRMLPIRALFGRFVRLTRDLAQAQGKQVRLCIRGEETELDRTLVEQMTDPLLHLVRNAIAHGLEPPAERRAHDKPEEGELILAASQQGGSVYLDVQDDGRGLDRARILARAIERGLVPADAELTDEAVRALIFEPGFSTASDVTEVSGRGVGMDVVRRRVLAVGGSLSLDTTRGRGTRVRIRLPLTLVSLEGLLVRVGAESYVLPLAAVTECVKLGGDTRQAFLGVMEAVSLRGTLVPLIRLPRRVGVDGAVEDARRGLAVVVEHEGRRSALLVDELLGQQQVVIKNLDVNYRRIDGIAGATILGDGRVALILDVPALAAIAEAA
jgi:two-component system chemotaxis sensor kinase CheA